MPVAHGHKTDCVQAVCGQFFLQGAGLLLGEAPDRRRPADRLIVMPHLFGARGRNQLGQRLSSDAGEGKIDDVGIAEKIEKKRLDRLRRVGAAKLEQNYTYSPCWVSHPPGILEEGGCYSKSVHRVNVELRRTDYFGQRWTSTLSPISMFIRSSPTSSGPV